MRKHHSKQTILQIRLRDFAAVGAFIGGGATRTARGGPALRLAQQRRSEGARARRRRRIRAVRRAARQWSGRVHEHNCDGLRRRHAVVAGFPNGAHVLFWPRRGASRDRARRGPLSGTPEDL